ncbi:MAG: methyltransferase [Deltaproteobacteria bacterium CG_4_10_14_0_2_um_filter_43_8]|nr:MAG: methyltransferase [Deltaproteobacteria bacterium CG11_big_fil_rev_8_21_14_0_20_42_23]PJA21726.1 MAG: methyltransferase [Deltaproteobacteria bacterium CG_4_10_14_0_2_um_filter_43_8]PJC64567.1 MAG: methyltransferase [Deltaproteobacteria bacterium CG_4_9_14_0_2_um_filter_42_21]
MAEIELLKSLPKGKRNVKSREAAKTDEHIRISREYGEMYFDGPREYGYGGYHYDGRWQPVAKDIINHFGLKPGDRVLDIGCAKGFLVKDLCALGIDAYGLDISSYALMHCEPEVVGRLQLGSADYLPFPDDSFTAALSINTVHNLDRADCVKAIHEMQRVAPRHGYVQVDAYRTEREKEVFLDWVLTAKTHGTPEQWIQLLKEADYRGDYYWTILEVDPEWTTWDETKFR